MPVCPVCRGGGVEGSGGGGAASPPIVEHSDTTKPQSEKSPLFAFIVVRWYSYTFATYKAVYLPSN